MILLDELVNRCGCELCRLEINSMEREQHHLINLLMGRMDEQMRRWFAAYLARLYGNISFVALVTGMSEKTIRRGIKEMEKELKTCSPDRTRSPGAGRPSQGK